MENKETFSEVVIDSKTVILHLLNGTEVIGSVMYMQDENELYNLFVDIKHRGVGNAHKLLKEAIFRYSPKYITASKVYGSDVERLIKLYSSVGFKLNDVRMHFKV